MNLCSSGHEEIVHENSYKCPLCMAWEEIEILHGKISELSADVNSAEAERDELQKIIDAEPQEG